MHVEVPAHGTIDAPEEAEELLGTVPRQAFADNEPALHVKRGEQRRGAVPLVVVRRRCGAPALQRQPRLAAVERLDLAFFIDAKHESAVGRVHVKPDDIGDFRIELGIVGNLDALDEVRFEARLAPDAPHARCRNAHLGRHRLAAPVGGVTRRLVGGLGDDGKARRLGQRRNARGARLVP